MTDRSRPWEIAIDLEKAAIALRAAAKVLDAIHGSAQVFVEDTCAEVLLRAQLIQALSDKYQAIADAEPDTVSVEGLS